MSHPTSFRFRPQTLDLLDRLAAKLQRSRTATLTFLIERGADALLEDPSDTPRAFTATEYRPGGADPRIPDELVRRLVEIVLEAGDVSEKAKRSRGAR